MALRYGVETLASLLSVFVNRKNKRFALCMYVRVRELIACMGEHGASSPFTLWNKRKQRRSTRRLGHVHCCSPAPRGWKQKQPNNLQINRMPNVDCVHFIHFSQIMCRKTHSSKQRNHIQTLAPVHPFRLIVRFVCRCPSPCVPHSFDRSFALFYARKIYIFNAHSNFLTFSPRVCLSFLFPVLLPISIWLAVALASADTHTHAQHISNNHLDMR